MTTKIATRDAYGQALAELASQRPDIVVLDADLSKSTKTVDFAKKSPERFFNVGIAEQNLMGVAAGLAAAGKVPFASTFAVFAAGRAYDQVRNVICYGNLNVKIVATHGGLTVGEDGATHQALEDISLMRTLPNMRVIVPADGNQTKKVIFAIADLPGPFYVRLGRPQVPVIYGEDYTFVLGQGEILRQGKDAAIIATGFMVHLSLQAHEQLAAQGISVRVVNMPTIKPLDIDLVHDCARSCGAILTVEEHNIIGGLGSAVAEAVVETRPVPVLRLGVKDRFGLSGEPNELLRIYGLSVEDIVEGVKALLQRKS